MREDDEIPNAPHKLDVWKDSPKMLVGRLRRIRWLSVVCIADRSFVQAG